MRVLVTGAAGFIGMHVSRALLGAGHEVLGIDNLNTYYDPFLKHARLNELAGFPAFSFERADLAEDAQIQPLFRHFKPEYVVHLAAQAGVRHSLDAPRDYTRSNIEGFLTILEACRHHPVKHLVYASSSSVYGANTKVPFHEDDPVSQPISLYAATKRANELMAQTYAHLFATPMTGLRFFTVYGPWGRPDMAVWKFTDAILAGQPIALYDPRTTARDFTHIRDIVGGIMALLPLAPAAEGQTPHRILNIGNNNPVRLDAFVSALEAACGKRAITTLAPRPPGDVAETYADITSLAALTGFRPATAIEDGLVEFVNWYRGWLARTPHQ